MDLNKIYNEDCLEGMKDIPDSSIDLIVTDPPYLINYKSKGRKGKEHRFNNVILNDDNEYLIKGYIKECYRILKDDTAMYMFCSAAKVDFFKTELEKYFAMKNMIIWEKDHFTLGDLEHTFGRKYEIVFLVNKGIKKFNGKRLGDVWKFKRVLGDKQVHQNQKPIELIEQCIEKHSDENDIIFDGFMGSGTTAVAAMNTNRRYIGFELDEYYYNVAMKRLNNHDPHKQMDLLEMLDN